MLFKYWNEIYIIYVHRRIFAIHLFGVLGGKVSVRITLPLTTVLHAILTFSVIFLDLTATMFAMVFFFLVGFVNGEYEATQMRIGMDNSPSIVGGSVYNLYNSLSNVGQIAIGSIAIAAFVTIVGDYRFG